MMKKMYLFGLYLAIPFILSSQEADTVESFWSREGMVSLNVSQVSFRNWSAGGINSVSYNSFLNYKANYKRDRISWENSLDLAYGILNQADQKAIKSDDKIDFSSKFGRSLTEKLLYSALISFRSQFADGYNKPADEEIISTFMAPAYLVMSLGMDYQPNNKLTFFLSPLTGKTTFVLNETLSNAGAFGVDPGKKTKSEFGGFFKAAFQTDLLENVSLQTKLDLFSNYLDKPKNWDVNWDTQILLKVNQYISGNVFTQLIYDEDILLENEDAPGTSSPKIQFKQLLGLGFSYKF
jgi:hypothetical protein